MRRWLSRAGQLALDSAHQHILYYLVALALCLAWTVPVGRARIREVVAGDGLPAWLRVATAAVAAVAALYVALGLMARFDGGFAVTLLDVHIGLQNPQKLWRIGAALLALFTAIRLVAQFAHERHRGEWPRCARRVGRVRRRADGAGACRPASVQ